MAFYPESGTILGLATRSESGGLFGIQVDTGSLSETGYAMKVQVVDGEGALGW